MSQAIGHTKHTAHSMDLTYCRDFPVPCISMVLLGSIL